MEKYLLINNYSNFGYDDDELTSNVYVVGSYDTIEKCLSACEDEIYDQAVENAECMFDLDDADEETISQGKQEYIDNFCYNHRRFGITEEDFAVVGASHYVMEHWADGGNYKLENQFLAVRIS